MPEETSKLLGEWFWTDRWMGSSAFLLPIEPRGLYREMLTQAWRRGAQLPNDHEAIRRAVGCTRPEWNRCWPRIQGYWRIDGDVLVNDTQIEVYREMLAGSQRASTRGAKGAAARWHKHSPSDAQALPEQWPPKPTPKPLSEKAPRESARLAFGGKRLEVPKFLDDEFVKRLNGQFFDLTVFYQALDMRLVQTGESWDIRWIRDQFAAESPKPERRVVRDLEERPITADERTRAERHRRSVWGGCKHEPKCDTAGACVAAIVRTWREQEIPA